MLDVNGFPISHKHYDINGVLKIYMQRQTRRWDCLAHISTLVSMSIKHVLQIPWIFSECCKKEREFSSMTKTHESLIVFFSALCPKKMRVTEEPSGHLLSVLKHTGNEYAV